MPCTIPAHSRDAGRFTKAAICGGGQKMARRLHYRTEPNGSEDHRRVAQSNLPGLLNKRFQQPAHPLIKRRSGRCKVDYVRHRQGRVSVRYSKQHVVKSDYQQPAAALQHHPTYSALEWRDRLHQNAGPETRESISTGVNYSAKPTRRN